MQADYVTQKQIEWLKLLRKNALILLGSPPLLIRDDGNEKCNKPTTDDLMRTLEKVCLGHIADRFGGLDSIHEWSSVLSLGEQQRLAFARLLLSQPKLALLDESTSALDEANEVLVDSPLIYHLEYHVTVALRH